MFLGLGDLHPLPPTLRYPAPPALRREEPREDAVRSTHQLAAELQGTEEPRAKGWRGQGPGPAPPRRRVPGLPGHPPQQRGFALCVGRPGPPPSTPQGSELLGKGWSSAMRRTRTAGKVAQASWTLKIKINDGPSPPGYFIGTAASGGNDG